MRDRKPPSDALQGKQNLLCFDGSGIGIIKPFRSAWHVTNGCHPTVGRASDRLFHFPGNPGHARLDISSCQLFCQLEIHGLSGFQCNRNETARLLANG